MRKPAQLRTSAAVVGVLILLSSPRLQASSGPTPADVLARLRAGNETFVANPEAALPIDQARRSAVVQAQTPIAAVLSCADSRVPPEVVFHASLGELVVVRSVGHVADRSVLASLEYAADRLHVPVIVVMGHESCDAVKTATDAPAGAALGGNLDYLVGAIRPAVSATRSAPENTRLRAAILRHVEDTVNALVDDSATLRHLAEAGTLALVGAYYELQTGRAYFSQPVMLPPASQPVPQGEQPGQPN